MAIKEDTNSSRRALAKSSARTPREPRSPRGARKNEWLVHDIVGIALIALGVFTGISLAAAANTGAVGQSIAGCLTYLFGVGAYVTPILLVGAGMVLITGQRPYDRSEIIGGSVSLWLIFLAWWDYLHRNSSALFDAVRVSAAGGVVGASITYVVFLLIGIGTPLLYLALAIMSVVWLTDMRLLHMLQEMFRTATKLSVPVKEAAATVSESRRERRQKKIEQLQKEESAGLRRQPATSRTASAPTDDETPTVQAPAKPFVSLPPAKPQVIVQKSLNLDRLVDTVDTVNPNYQLPPLDLLALPSPTDPKSTLANESRKATLMQTLKDFNIESDVKQVAVGPTVTRYEITLEPGILVKKIVALADNLAMALAAIHVRVEAPIPGKSAIGVEVPNEFRQTVTLRECLDTEEFKNAPSKLTFALGKDVTGACVYADLAKMPHVLVGGTTNSGKSCCLNSLISSLVYRATPREVQFIMIDPKRVELSLYDGIPHLLHPVVRDTKMAAGILRSVSAEMDKRYIQLADSQSRNIEGYNKTVEEKKRMPYIVVVIDELADLMSQHGQDVEGQIARLTQLARATGIHMVIATQRPSVDVVTGTIKANISSRIAFSVATNVDSRTILDTPGAERLIGRGDMLYLPIGAAKPVRLQGCFVGESETVNLVKYLKKQEEPRYTLTATAASDGFGNGEPDGADTDELFEPAVRWLVGQRERGASTSSLQRRFKIGYTRAARLVEFMEARDIVGPQEGAKPREVLLHPSNLDAYFGSKQQGVVTGNMAYPDDEEETDAAQTAESDEEESPF